ncbi:MAG TPA: hypothetical protein VIT89_00215 [Solirubrobacterales bacterium]
MTREAIESAVDEWVREVAVNHRVGVPDSAGGFEIADYRSYLIGHMPTGDPPTTGLRSHHLSLRFLLTAEETKTTIDPMLKRLHADSLENPELGGRLDYRTRLDLGEAVVAKRGERNHHGGPVVVLDANVREFDFGDGQAEPDDTK